MHHSGSLVGTLFLCVVAGIAYLRRVLHGGFVLDDWVQVSLWRRTSSFHDFLSADLHAYPFRPGDDLGLAVLYGVFGEHAKGHFTFSILSAVIASVLLAEILRHLGVHYLHAYLIGALVLVAPLASSMRLWSIMGLGTAAIAIAEAAVLVGLRGAARSGRSFAGHTAAATLLVLGAMLTYEVTAAVFAVSILLYAFVMPRRRAFVLWAANVVPVAVATLYSAHARRGTGIPEQTTLSVVPTNVRRIAGAIPDIVSRSLFPVDSPSGRLAVAVVILITAIGILVSVRGPDVARRREMRRWVSVLVGGAVVTACGWATFAASPSAYTPVEGGIENRINAVSSIGLAIGVYAMGAIVVAVVSYAGRLNCRTTVILTALVGCAVLIPYVRETRAHVAAYQRSYADELAIIGWFQRAIPTPAPSSNILLYGAPLNVDQVPVFRTTYDLGQALQALYHDGSIQAMPVSEVITVACGPADIVVSFYGTPYAHLPYGKTFLADYMRRRVDVLATPASCTELTTHAPVSPWMS